MDVRIKVSVAARLIRLRLHTNKFIARKGETVSVAGRSPGPDARGQQPARRIARRQAARLG
jgi:hypothetical protein